MENNDIRLAIHALTTQGKRLETALGELHDKADAIAKSTDARIGAVLEQIANLKPLADLLVELERMLEEDLPEFLDKIEKNPMAKAILGTGFGPLKAICSGLQDKVK